MPTDHCVFFHDCPACQTVLRPKAGDCCVFCSYGDKRCPSVQDGIPCPDPDGPRSEEHTSELQSPDHLVCPLLLEKKKKTTPDPQLSQPPTTTSHDLTQCL